MWQMFVLQSGGGDVGSFISNYGMIMLMLIVVWFFFFRPQAKRQKQQAKFIDEIKKGDEVVTNSGLIGRINKIEDNIVTIDIGNKTFVRVLKSTVSRDMTESIKSSDA